MTKSFLMELLTVYTHLFIVRDHLGGAVEWIRWALEQHPELSSEGMQEELDTLAEWKIPEEVDVPELVKLIPHRDVGKGMSYDQFARRLKGLREEYRDVAPMLKAV